MSTLRFTMSSKLSKKANGAVKALAVLPTIPDLAEAWNLKLNMYKPWHSPIFYTVPHQWNQVVKPTEASIIQQVMESGPI